jgi:MFS family permease
MLYLAMGFFGFGWFTTAPLNAGLVADLFGNLNMGAIIGITLSCHMLGMAVSAYAGGLIYELFGSYYWAFLSLGFFELLAALFAFLIRQKRPPVPRITTAA